MKSFHLYQLIIILISLYMIYQAIRDYSKGKNDRTFYGFLTRLVIWGVLLFLGFFPTSISILAKFLGIIYDVNVVVLIGFLLAFVLIFKLFSSIERLEKNISDLTRKEALKGIEEIRKEK